MSRRRYPVILQFGPIPPAQLGDIETGDMWTETAHRLAEFLRGLADFIDEESYLAYLEQRLSDDT